VLGTVAHTRSQILQCGGELVAHALELTEVEQRRAGGG
jgi:hypothetical protein